MDDRTRDNEPSGFKCATCGKFHAFTAYVFAHMRDELMHHCDDCGAIHSIQNGVATQTQAGTASLPPKETR